jgi:hypothetical protein
MGVKKVFKKMFKAKAVLPVELTDTELILVQKVNNEPGVALTQKEVYALQNIIDRVEKANP